MLLELVAKSCTGPWPTRENLRRERGRGTWRTRLSKLRLALELPGIRRRLRSCRDRASVRAQRGTDAESLTRVRSLSWRESTLLLTLLRRLARLRGRLLAL